MISLIALEMFNFVALGEIAHIDMICPSPMPTICIELHGARLRLRNTTRRQTQAYVLLRNRVLRAAKLKTNLPVQALENYPTYRPSMDENEGVLRSLVDREKAF